MTEKEDKEGGTLPPGQAPGAKSVDSPGSDLETASVPLVNESSLLKKIDARILPAVGILYLLSFLDRSNGESLTLFLAVALSISSRVLTWWLQLVMLALRDWLRT